MRCARSAALVATLALLPGAAPTPAAGRLGVVLLHGELGAPGRVIDGLGQALTRAGYLVGRPDMCWSARRGYEQAFPDCLAAIDDAAMKLRNLGAMRIVVGGFSLGAIAAIAYCAEPGRCLGTIAIAPDHDARRLAGTPGIAAGIAQARQAVAAGHGDDDATFADISLGPDGTYETEIATTPAIYLSFFGAGSAATLAGTLGRLATPLLWVAGRSDPDQAAATPCAQAPGNTQMRCVSVDGSHLGTADAARAPVLAWLAALATR